ncbi:uncharacterized protein LOC144073042 [Stigmatopora argus]
MCDIDGDSPLGMDWTSITVNGVSGRRHGFWGRGIFKGMHNRPQICEEKVNFLQDQMCAFPDLQGAEKPQSDKTFLTSCQGPGAAILSTDCIVRPLRGARFPQRRPPAPSPGGAILYLEFKGRLEDKQRNFRPVNMDWVLLHENSADREVNSSWLRNFADFDDPHFLDISRPPLVDSLSTLPGKMDWTSVNIKGNQRRTSFGRPSALAPQRQERRGSNLSSDRCTPVCPNERERLDERTDARSPRSFAPPPSSPRPTSLRQKVRRRPRCLLHLITVTQPRRTANGSAADIQSISTAQADGTSI